MQNLKQYYLYGDRYRGITIKTMFQSSTVIVIQGKKKKRKRKTKRQSDLSKKDIAVRKAKIIILLFRKSGLDFVWFLYTKVLRLLSALFTVL